MRFLDVLSREPLFYDGAMGTMLQAAGLLPGESPDVWSVTHPDAVRDIHLQYLDAGCNIVTTNTFGCTASKLAGTGFTPGEVAAAAVARAREAIAVCGGAQKKFAAFDVGPTGKLLKPLGDLAFEDAVRLFTESIRAGAQAGADLIHIETMSDTYELKAAVLAAKESCALPVCATVTLDQNGRLLTGGDIHAVVALLEGLRVDALGLNCGLGPKEMIKFLPALREITSLPVILNPNAGLPREENGKTVFDVGPAEFAELMAEAARGGARLLGGCCGTTPAHIKALVAACRDIPPLPVEKKERTVVSSYGRAVYFEGHTVLVGERINPTGRSRLKQALREGDVDYVLREGLAEEEAGAEILGVNAGLPGIDESAVLTRMVAELQGVTKLPLQIDTADPNAFVSALRVYNGKPVINSVNGREDVMRAVFPLAAKYGGVVIALTIDEAGIPETARGRLAIAKKILARAAEYGIEKKNILVDALTLTVSAGDRNPAVTLEALSLIKKELGVKTTLGVSNISFGLPRRELMTASFLTLALYAGLDSAIINPLSQPVMDAFFTAHTLLGRDAQCAAYLARYAGQAAPDTPAASPAPGPGNLTLEQAIRQGLKRQAAALAADAKDSPLGIIEGNIVPALNAVGAAFEAGTFFLPQLLMSADAAKAAFEVLRGRMTASEGAPLGCVVLATVEGDVHDIGKNIVKALLENFRFQVVDLGRDVPPSAVVEAALRHKPRLVGLSALMTTTVASMEKTIAALHRDAPGCKIMVGGAVLTADYAQRIGADFYGRDAMASVRYAQEVYGG